MSGQGHALAPEPALSDEYWASGHESTLRVGNALFIAGCLYMILLATLGWVRGESSARAPLLLVIFLVANAGISWMSIRAKDATRAECLRVVVGTVLVPSVYLYVDGPLNPWWPGAVFMGVASAVHLGVLNRGAFWGRVLVVYYATWLVGANLLWREQPDWYAVIMQVCVALIVGLMFAQIMSLLGDSMRDEKDRSKALAVARDALVAEMAVAQEIQTLLLPRKPTMPDHDVVGEMIPAAEVGGDYYDVIDVDGRGVFLAIGDVSGHGVTSGVTMMMARASLVGALEANSAESLSELYRILNRCICQNLLRMDLRLYMTFALLEYIGGGQFHAVGRHLPILIYRKKTDAVEEVELQGMWLGVIGDLKPEHLPVTTLTLEEGDLLLLYTDGIVEHAEKDGEMFGFERLVQSVVRHGPEGPRELINALVSELRAYAAAQDDDVTMLAINHTGAVATSHGV